MSAASQVTSAHRCGRRGAARLRHPLRVRALRAALVVAGAAALLPPLAAAESGPSSAASIDLCGFRPTFIEDFDTLSVSPYGGNGSRWIAHTPWHGDFGDAAFVDPRPGFPFRVNNGVLEIEARRDRDGNWQSGLLASATPSTSGFAQQFGYFETRAKLPPGPGTWPAFWLNTNLPRGSKQPGVEIDVLEYYGHSTDAYNSVVHVWNSVDPKKSREQGQAIKVPPGSLTSDFHTYGANVTKDSVTFYLDRQEKWRTPTPPELKAPLMVLVNLALGSGWPIDKTPSPSIMQVDYIHVYAPRVPGDTGSCPSGQPPASAPRQGGENSK